MPVQPAMIIDTRVVKRFDIGRLRRQDVFAEFEKRRIAYIEAEPAQSHDGGLSFSLLDKTLATLGNQPRRVIVFADGDEIVEAVREHYLAEAVPGRSEGWAVRVIPAEIQGL